MVASTSTASSHTGITVRRPAIRMQRAVAAQAATNHRPGSITTAGGGGGTGLFTLQLFPGHEGGAGDPDRDGNERRAELDQQARDENAGADEELPFHFHIIITKTAASIPASTSAGIVSGFVQCTSRTALCCRVRMSCICFLAIASCMGVEARLAARLVSSSARLRTRSR